MAYQPLPRTLRGPFPRIKLDRHALKFLGRADEPLRACLESACHKIRAGNTDLLRVGLRDGLYSAEACGHILYFVVAPDRKLVVLSSVLLQPGGGLL